MIMFRRDRPALVRCGRETFPRRTLGGESVAGFNEDFSYDPIGNRISSTDYDETGAARTSLYTANSLNQYTLRAVPGWASVRGLADADATVAVNGNPAYALASGDLAYFFGSDDFDNSAGGGFAELEVSATVNTGTSDLVSVVTNCVFVPPANETYAYDADGNQTLVTTGTGAWHVEYNGENRPIRWTCDDKTVLMAYDHMGRRHSYVEQKGNVVGKRHVFTYDGYLQIARSRVVDADFGAGDDAFLWDPTEPVATRPLVCSLATPQSLNYSTFFYALDGNKNVTGLVGEDGEIAAHYEYSAFGKTLLSLSADGLADRLNLWRFSSEYADDATRLVYYNYRHYNSKDGRWCSSDPMNEPGFFFAPIVNTTSYCLSSIGFLDNKVPNLFDHVGLLFACTLCEDEKCKNLCNGKLSESGFSGGIYTCQQFIWVRCKCYGMCNLLMEIKPPWPRGQYTCFYECGNTQQTWTQYTPCEQHKLWGL